MKIQFRGESGYWQIVVDGVVQGAIEGPDCYVIEEGRRAAREHCVIARFKYGRISEAKRWLKVAIARFGSMDALFVALQENDPETGQKWGPTSLVPMPLPRRSAAKTEAHVIRQRAWAHRVARLSGGLEASVFYGLETECQFHAKGQIEVLDDALKVGDLEISFESVQSLWAHHSVKTW